MLQVFSIYKLTVGGIPYFGFTSRSPKDRLEDHLAIAKKNKWKHNSKLYPKLREEKFRYEFEVVAEYESEIEALLKEIMCIRDAGIDNTLNYSCGGEGKTITVKIREFKNGNLQFKVVPKRKAKKRKRQRRRTRRI